MHPVKTMTVGQARETIDRLSLETKSLRTHAAVSEAMIEEYNGALAAFVPRSKTHLFYIGKGRYVGDTSRPGAFVPSGVLRELIERARTEFDALLSESQPRTPKR